MQKREREREREREDSEGFETREGKNNEKRLKSS